LESGILHGEYQNIPNGAGRRGQRGAAAAHFDGLTSCLRVNMPSFKLYLNRQIRRASCNRLVENDRQAAQVGSLRFLAGKSLPPEMRLIAPWQPFVDRHTDGNGNGTECGRHGSPVPNDLT